VKKGRPPYATLDVDYCDNVKVIRAGEKAELLYVRGLVLTRRLRLDGFIGDEHLDLVGIRMAGVPARVKRLVEVGLWTRVDGGYQIVDYLERNKSAVTIAQEDDAKRDANTERMRRVRAAETAHTDPVRERTKSHADPVRALEAEAEAEAEANPPPQGTSDSRSPSLNGAGLTPGEEEDSGDKSRSKGEKPEQDHGVETALAHLQRTSMVIAARRLLARPEGSEPIKRADRWQKTTAAEAASHFRDEHLSIFLDSIALTGEPPTEQEMADALEPPTGLDAIAASAAEDGEA